MSQELHHYASGASAPGYHRDSDIKEKKSHLPRDSSPIVLLSEQGPMDRDRRLAPFGIVKGFRCHPSPALAEVRASIRSCKASTSRTSRRPPPRPQTPPRPAPIRSPVPVPAPVPAAYRAIIVTAIMVAVVTKAACSRNCSKPSARHCKPPNRTAPTRTRRSRTRSPRSSKTTTPPRAAHRPLAHQHPAQPIDAAQANTPASIAGTATANPASGTSEPPGVFPNAAIVRRQSAAVSPGLPERRPGRAKWDCRHATARFKVFRRVR